MIDVKMDCTIAVKTMVRQINTATVNINKILVIGNQNAKAAVVNFLDSNDTYEYPGEHMQQNRPGSDSQVRTSHGSDHFRVQKVQNPSTTEAFYGIVVGQNPEEPEPIGTYILAGTLSHEIEGYPLVWRRSKSGFTGASNIVEHPGAASYGTWLGDNIEQIAENQLHKAVGAIILLGDDLWRLQPSVTAGTAIAFTSNKSSGNREDVQAMGSADFGGDRAGEGPSWFEPTDRSF